jgi:hypothetical protein
MRRVLVLNEAVRSCCGRSPPDCTCDRDELPSVTAARASILADDARGRTAAMEALGAVRAGDAEAAVQAHGRAARRHAKLAEETDDRGHRRAAQLHRQAAAELAIAEPDDDDDEENPDLENNMARNRRRLSRVGACGIVTNGDTDDLLDIPTMNYAGMPSFAGRSAGGRPQTYDEYTGAPPVKTPKELLAEAGIDVSSDPLERDAEEEMRAAVDRENTRRLAMLDDDDLLPDSNVIGAIANERRQSMTGVHAGGPDEPVVNAAPDDDDLLPVPKLRW